MRRLKTIFAALSLGLAGAALAQPASTMPAATQGAAPISGATTPTVQDQATATTTPAAGATPGAPTATTATVPTAAKAVGPAVPLMAPTPGIGMPTDGVHLQPQVTEIGSEAAWMHNAILMPVMTAMSVLVLVLLLVVVVKFRASANPVPSKTTHNTFIEIIWTVAPVLVLLAIAVPSIQLIARQYSPPKADLTVKVIGNQWYWTYQYPDNGDLEIVSNMLPEEKRKAIDGPRLLAVDERMVVPAGKVVKIITTSNDVIHSFAVPAFWTKMDAVPGRLNETWFKVDRPGVYFGQCSELCGARHGFMPIAVEVVPPAEFAQWIASKGGTMPGAKPVNNPDATSAASPAVAGSAAAGGSAVATPAPAITGTISKPVPTSQGATDNKGSQVQ